MNELTRQLAALTINERLAAADRYRSARHHGPHHRPHGRHALAARLHRVADRLDG